MQVLSLNYDAQQYLWIKVDFTWYWLFNEDSIKWYCKYSFENKYYNNFMPPWICQYYKMVKKKIASATSIMKGLKSFIQKPSTQFENILNMISYEYTYIM